MLLNSEIRGQIQVLSDQGLKQVEIAKKLNINQSTVSRNLKERCKPNLEANENKTNRKRKVNEKVTSALFKIIKKTPKKSIRKMAQEINQVTKISISHMTVKRILNDNNFKAYSPLKKPLLSKKNIRLRKERCEEFLFLSDDEIKSIIWSDESKFNLFTSDGKIKVWREPGTGLDIKHVHSTVKYGGGSVMVWACFSYQGVGKLVFIDGIMDSKKYECPAQGQERVLNKAFYCCV